ncbi:hypothetical protein BH09BAC3_BH09BAC3_20320 [soil metagenome]
MKNLKNTELIEMTNSEMTATTAGFGLIPLIFFAGMALAYYEKHGK